MSNHRKRNERAEPTALYSEDAEKVVVGFCLTNPDEFYEQAGKLEPEHFSFHHLAQIWAAMQRCANSGKRINRNLVLIYLKNWQHEHAPKIILELLMQDVADGDSAIDINVYVDTVRLLAGKRALIDAHLEAISKIKTSDVSTPLEDMSSESVSTILSVSSTTGNRYIKTYAQIADEFVRELDKDMRQGDEGTGRGLNCGLRGVQEVFGPLMPGGLYVLGGMSSAGKTALMKGMMESASEDAKGKGLGWTYMASMEMTERQHVVRSISEHLGLNSYKLQRSQVNADEFENVMIKGVKFMSRFPIEVDRTPFLSLEKIRTNMISLKNRRGIAFAVIDHILLIKFGSKESMMDRVMDSMIWAKSMASELDIPILMLSQLNEPKIIERKSGEPISSDFFGGQAIQQNADASAIIHRPEMVLRQKGANSQSAEDVANFETRLASLKGKAILIGTKGRDHGMGIRRELSFDGPTVSFRDV